MKDLYTHTHKKDQNIVCDCEARLFHSKISDEF